MRLSGRRLTLVLAALLVVVLAAGAVAAWSFGRNRPAPLAALADYHAGPSTDRSVRLGGDAPAHPQAPAVRSLLQNYFDAINNRDYDGWLGAVATMQSAPQSRARWTHDYATTVDSNVRVMLITDGPLRARTVFTSEQSVELAPPALRVGCINWDVTYLLGEQDGHLVLTGIDPSAQSMTACG